MTVDTTLTLWDADSVTLTGVIPDASVEDLYFVFTNQELQDLFLLLVQLALIVLWLFLSTMVGLKVISELQDLLKVAICGVTSMLVQFVRGISDATGEWLHIMTQDTFLE